MPAYPWKCYSCAHANAAEVDTCAKCGFQSHATAREIDAARAVRRLQRSAKLRERNKVADRVPTEVLELVIAITELPRVHQVFGVIILALAALSVVLLVDDDSELGPLCGIAGLVGCYLALRTLVAAGSKQQ